MNIFKKQLLGLLLYTILGISAIAQTIDGQFIPTLSGATLNVKVQIKASTSVGLGVTTLTFAYDTSKLSIPSSPVAGTDYSYSNFGAGSYSTSTVTRPSLGKISINIDYSGTPPSTSVMTTFMDVVTISFSVIDPSSATNLLWDTPIEIYKDDNATPLTMGTFTNANNVALPIEMTSFEAKVQEGAAVLHWTTASESNNEGFAVEHSTDAKMWKQVGFVQGNGTTTTAQNYIFNTENLAIGTHYFRLKQKDYSGAIKYSESVQVMVEVAGKFMLNPAYPNPFNPEANIEFAVATSQNVTMELYNTLGQRVALLYQGKPVANELQKVQINGSNLPSGIYMVRLTGENFRQTQKITLVK